MYRKFAAALVALVIAVGAIFAEEIKAVFVKYEDGTITVKVDDKEKKYKVTDETKVKFGKKEVAATKVLEKGYIKEGRKLTLTVEKEALTVIEPEKQTDK